MTMPAQSTEGDEDRSHAFYAPETFRSKFWRRLGFRYASLWREREAALQFDTEPDKWLATDTFIKFDWADRFRILVSGRVMVQHNHRTDVKVSQCASMSAVGVLPPYHRDASEKPDVFQDHLSLRDMRHPLEVPHEAP